ncbi:hypothetical protein AK812_SmicGene28875 [Symbiodinium microadriaticum]|uniref:Uncharacterized protein n=1 Tax=Symbiodinium microadriaticum TaxID=2951 RepID=A0A1Q9D3A6_SYMMI|nr:hypothetical protein AK812_SmicGene28875 [Symbiodinium microadriaticum]
MMATCGSCCERTGDEQLHVIAIQVAESLENTDDASEQEPVGDQMSMSEEALQSIEALYNVAPSVLKLLS